MAKEAIEKIKMAEDKADDVLKRAAERSRQITQNAQNEAEQMKKESLEKVKSEKLKIQQEYDKKYSDQAELLKKESLKRIDSLHNSAGEAMNDAAKLIVERLECNYGNR